MIIFDIILSLVMKKIDYILSLVMIIFVLLPQNQRQWKRKSSAELSVKGKIISLK